MGSLESRIGHGVSACGDQCVDHAVSALVTCKAAALKALRSPRGAFAGIPRGKRSSVVFICNSAQDEAEECARNDCVYWMHSSANGRKKNKQDLVPAVYHSQWW